MVNQSTLTGPFSIQGATNVDVPAANNQGFFISVNLFDFLVGESNQLLANVVTFAGGIPTLSPTISMHSPDPAVPLFYVATIPVNILGTPSSHMVDPVTTFRPSPANIRIKLYTSHKMLALIAMAAVRLVM